MYESRKNMGDVCEDVSSSIEKRKDVLSEEQQHHRNSEPRQDETQLHLSDTTELGIKDFVSRKIISRYERYKPEVLLNRDVYFSELFKVRVIMMISEQKVYFDILYDMDEMENINTPIEKYVFEKAVRFIDEEIKKYI